MRIADLLPFDQHGLMTRRTAMATGLIDADLRRLQKEDRIVWLRGGVYVDGAAWAAADPYHGRPLLRIRAAQLTLRCEHVLSHDSAAIILGLGVPSAANALVHITRPKVHGDAVRAGVKHHLAPYRPEQVLTVDGLQVLDPARTGLDMAREHGLIAGVACCDAALRAGTTTDDLQKARVAMRCWPGSRLMDASIEMCDAGAESWLESAARVLVTSLGIGRPETQFGLTHAGRTVWCDLRVGRHIFEVDGGGKYKPAAFDDRTPEQVLWDEKTRQDFVTGFKLGVSRITTADTGHGWHTARARLMREFQDTCARFGTDTRDLAPYRPARPRRLR